MSVLVEKKEQNDNLHDKPQPKTVTRKQTTHDRSVFPLILHGKGLTRHKEIKESMWSVERFQSIEHNLDKYVKLMRLYGSERRKEKRWEGFYKKYEKFRMRFYREEMMRKCRQQLARSQKNERIFEELRRSRAMFEDRKNKRLSKQYVTGKILEYEKEGRQSFGLPLLLPEKTTISRAALKKPQMDSEKISEKVRRIARQNHAGMFDSFHFPNAFNNHDELVKLRRDISTLKLNAPNCAVENEKELDEK